MSKSKLLYIATGICIVAVVLGTFAWLWQLASRPDATSSQHSLGAQLMQMKTESMVDLRAGLASKDYRQLEDGIARLREVNEVANWYLAQERYGEASSNFRRALEELDNHVQNRDLAQARESFDQLKASCQACHERGSNVPLDQDLQPLPK